MPLPAAAKRFEAAVESASFCWYVVSACVSCPCQGKLLALLRGADDGVVRAVLHGQRTAPFGFKAFQLRTGGVAGGKGGFGIRLRLQGHGLRRAEKRHLSAKLSGFQFDGFGGVAGRFVGGQSFGRRHPRKAGTECHGSGGDGIEVVGQELQNIVKLAQPLGGGRGKQVAALRAEVVQHVRRGVLQAVQRFIPAGKRGVRFSRLLPHGVEVGEMLLKAGAELRSQTDKRLHKINFSRIRDRNKNSALFTVCDGQALLSLGKARVAMY